MIDTAKAYNSLASAYHLIFQDWPASIERQAGIISKLLAAPEDTGPVLDCACGIGTQALGLAALGYEIEGTAISPAEIERASREAASRKLNVSFRVDDMRLLKTAPCGRYGAVLCMDNALPHLDSEDDILTALKAMHVRLRAGGTLLLSLRDYEQLMRERPSIMPPTFYQDGQCRCIVHQVWDWTDERRYRFHLYLTVETNQGWWCHHVTGQYRAITPSELAALTGKAGFGAVQVLSPDESGYYQPMIRAAS
jgi:SAM-dependent methyltransferase